MAPTEPSFSIPDSYCKIQTALASFSTHASPEDEDVSTAASALPTVLPARGRGEEATLEHMLDELMHGFNGSKTSANYYGFVTGGVLPIAEVADNLVTTWDQNVGVHLPEYSVATLVEDRALAMLVELLELNGPEREGALSGGRWLGRTFTTGATSSNVLGLACGREAVLTRRIAARSGKKSEGTEPISVGELGLLEACRLAGVEEIQILTTMAHSSTFKAASIVGIGRSHVIDVGQADVPWKFDIDALERALQKPGTASIISLSCGEVNTGRFATSNYAEVAHIRALCDKYDAWLHVDGAFGLFARALPAEADFNTLRSACAGVELADSITSDAHKCLNVPYDCGFFLTPSARTLSAVFQNPNAAYLTAAAADAAVDPRYVPSPLNIGIENSRRFRALPVYAVLVAHGRHGLADMLTRQVQLARAIAAYIAHSPAYELLPDPTATHHDIGIIVLFRAVRPDLNHALVAKINASKRVYVSGTMWRAQPACRIAVSTWKVNVERDLAVLKSLLEDVAREA